jgi:hypothetical protein
MESFALQAGFAGCGLLLGADGLEGRGYAILVPGALSPVASSSEMAKHESQGWPLDPWLSIKRRRRDTDIEHDP